MDAVTDLNGVVLTPLKIIPGEAGCVLHAMRAPEGQHLPVGEVYFSTVKEGAVKGWKRHRRMVLNIVVPRGAIRFYLLDGRDPLRCLPPQCRSVDLGPERNYQRMTVPAGIWMAFRGLAEGESILANLASIPHQPDEADALPLDHPEFRNVIFE